MKTKPRLTYDSIYYDYQGEKTICHLYTTLKIPNIIFSFPIIVFAESKPKNGDRYDREIGEKVALAKAENLAYRICKVNVETYYKDLHKKMVELAKIRDKCSRVVEHNINYLKLF